MPITKDPNYIFRDWMVEGVPEVGKPYKPKKIEIRQLLSEFQQSIIALEAGAQGLALPNLLIRWTQTNTDANTITATPQVTPPGAGLALNAMAISKDNTGAMTINKKPLLSNSGNALQAGMLKTGMIVLFFDHGDAWRLISDTASAAIQAAAEKARDAAAASAAAAKTSETNAKTSATAAANSATAAATSETNAKVSETSAAKSATAAKTSETNAGKSATAAATSATAAATSEANAKASETSASVSAAASKASETNAKASETNASTSATAAKIAAEKAEEIASFDPTAYFGKTFPALPISTDLNTIRTPGGYTLSSKYLNGPFADDAVYTGQMIVTNRIYGARTTTQIIYVADEMYIRVGIWDDTGNNCPWQKIITSKDQPFSKLSPSIPTGTDFDTMRSVGCYSIDGPSTYTNAPYPSDSGNNWGILLVYNRNTNGNQTTQIAVVRNEMYIRMGVSDVNINLPWQKVITSTGGTFTNNITIKKDNQYSAVQINVRDGTKEGGGMYLMPETGGARTDFGYLAGGGLRATIFGIGQVFATNGQATYSKFPYTENGWRVNPVGKLITLTGMQTPGGFVPANGTLLKRASYPDLWAFAQSSGNLCTEAQWQADQVNRGHYSSGDDSTTFRVPDLRGEFIRGFDDGRGLDSGRVFGTWQIDAIRNITGGLSIGGAIPNGAYGAISSSGGSVATGVGATLSYQYPGVAFDASRIVPTANENRPRNIAYNFFIKY